MRFNPSTDNENNEKTSAESTDSSDTVTNETNTNETETNKTPLVIDPKQTHQVSQWKHKTALTCLKTDPTSKLIAAGAMDLDVQLWNLAQDKHHVLKGHRSWVRSMDFSQDGSRLYTACWGGEIHVWDTSSDSPESIQSIKAHHGSARWVRLSPAGTQLATCGNDLLVKVWQLSDGKLLHEFKGHERHVYGVDFHPSGSHLVSQDLMGIVKIWNLTTGKEEHTIKTNMTGYDNKFAADMGGARDLQFNPDGSQWVSAGITKVTNSFAGKQDPIMVLFDWKTAKEVQQLTTKSNINGIAWGVRFHREGFIIGGIANQNGKGELWFYHPDKSEPFHAMTLSSAIRGIDLLNNQTQLATAHADGSIRIHQLTAKIETPADSAKETKEQADSKSVAQPKKT